MGLSESKNDKNSQQLGGLSNAPVVVNDEKQIIANAGTNNIVANGKVNKKALIVGINYYNSDHELKDCINDAYAIKKMLITYYGYPEESILMITDDTKSQVQPNRQNIISALWWLISDSTDTKEYHPGGTYSSGINPSKLFFHYSGHGLNIKNSSGSPITRMDNEKEAIIPIDYNTSGLIYDFQLRHIIDNVNSRSSLTVVMDCCYSEDNLDLAYNVESSDSLIVRQAINSRDINETRGDVMMIASCLDNQTDSDGRNGNGALTSAMVSICCGSTYSIKDLLNGVAQNFKYNNLNQLPSISFGRKHSVDDQFIM
jgi:hypothetical protein